MKRRRCFVIPVFVAVVLVAAVVARGAETSATYEPLRLYLEAMSVVSEQYVEPVSWDRLAHLGVRGIVAGLDADTELLSPLQYREVREGTSHGAGIGVVLTRRDQTLTVMTPIEGRPAAKAGLQTGDQFVEIDGERSTDLPPIDAQERLRGAVGSTVVVKVLRKGLTEPQPYSIVRAKAPSSTVRVRDLGDRVLDLRIDQVDEAAFRKLSDTLTTPAVRDARALILDLRDSAGKDVATAVEMAGLFLGNGTLAARVKTRNSDQPGELRTSTAPRVVDVPMAVLANRGTAGASEVLTGALHDAGRSVIVGATTFGDASTQSLIPLSDGSALSLTTARYLTPNGVAIDRKGIAPDFAVDASPDSSQARAGGAGVARRDPQLALAVDIVKAASIVEHGASARAERAASQR